MFTRVDIFQHCGDLWESIIHGYSSYEAESAASDLPDCRFKQWCQTADKIQTDEGIGLLWVQS